MPRLKRRKDFIRVARAGRSKAEPGLVLQAAPHPARDRTPGAAPLPDLRVGFTASRKVGGAVVRNRAKRRLRALADEILPDNARPDRDYVLIARAATPGREFSALRADLLHALAATKNLIDTARP